MLDIKYVVTHGGVAHMDELLAVGLAMKFWGHTHCYRRNPTAEELADRQVVVLDVGMQHDPDLRNFDHHQLPATDGDCAFSLLARHLKYERALKENAPWYESVRVLDSQGPKKWTLKYGHKRFPFELLSPLDAGMKKLFEQYHGSKPVDPTLTRILMEAVSAAIDDAQRLAEALDAIKEEGRHIQVAGLNGILLESKDSTGLNEYAERLSHEGLTLAFSVTLDDRDPGWCLYRFNDHPGIDFTRIRIEEGVRFAHGGGFIAKLEEMPLKAVLEFVERAIKKEVSSPDPIAGVCPECGCENITEGVKCPNCDFTQ